MGLVGDGLSDRSVERNQGKGRPSLMRPLFIVVSIFATALGTLFMPLDADIAKSFFYLAIDLGVIGFILDFLALIVFRIERP
jgi:hypothetical protein